MEQSHLQSVIWVQLLVQAWRGTPFIDTDEKSRKILHGHMGGKTGLSRMKKMEHEVREPARTYIIVPYLVDQTLLSGCKFADVKYISVYDENEVNICDTLTMEITVSKK